jgi:polyketide synthase PksN
MWRILAEAREVVQEIPLERFDWRLYQERTDSAGEKISWRCGCIPGVEEFDPLFFEISPREAESMDPRQRLLLQESWKALEDAGYGTAQLRAGKIGMFVGVEQGDYQHLTGATGTITSNHDAVLAARLAYFLNLSGPVMAINTACSSSLAAAHQACLSLRSRECDTAIVAGVNLILTPLVYVGLGRAGMLSPQGRCFAFDKRANGMVPGEAVAVVVLKRFSQARADGDPIYAVIQGSGINYDGKTNGITAPSGVAQANLLKSVYDRYQVNPEEIQYIVTHGTGTKLGDPVEINALVEAFKGRTGKQGYCALTSSKTNFGHAFAASGLVSLIALVQALRHETIPASLHCEEENDYIHWQGSPFYVNKTARPWPRSEGKSRTGTVSAFGMSGTNVHLVVRSDAREENPAAASNLAPYYLLALSAKTPEALQERIKDMVTLLENQENRESPAADLSRLSYTLLEGRQHFNFRCAIVSRDREDAVYTWKQAGGKEKLPNLFRGEVPRDFRGQTMIEQYGQDLLRQCRSRLGAKEKYRETLFVLADLYCQGYALVWELLYGESKPPRLHLPTYPFAREHYWIDGAGSGLPTGENVQEPRVRPGDEPGTKGRQTPAPGPVPSPMGTGSLVSLSVEHLKGLIAEVTKIPLQRLDSGAGFAELGLDSFMISLLNQEIEQWVGKLEAALFFKYNNIRDLGRYLADAYPEAVSKLVKPGAGASPDPRRTAVAGTVPSRPISRQEPPTPGVDIAIVGLAGRYPQAATLEQFWRNLVDGKDCIVEIPPQRWSLQGFFEPDRVKAVANGLSYSKWGGFLDNIDRFDPLFFNISPREAVVMDPQERLFLEVAWECLENAGYTRQSLQKAGYGNRIGVFVGATFNNYQLLMAEAALQANQTMYPALSQIYSIANRVSYVMNFTGPSLTVDTACSSSLYALHLACESIRGGQSRWALAGGVNLSIHPSKYIVLAQGQFSAEDGRCRAFCEGGTGYVPAEAVGAVLLKPLPEAINDNDHIYGLIKGTAVSHAGKTNGYTVPSPVSQSLAIEEALERSRVHPREISCIEAHGTGTALGDPIEITGLTDVFRKYTEETGFCAISSVKSNIGHAEAAAGIAQVTKVLLQFQHQTLVKNLRHGQGLNPNIDFESTPFVVQECTENWKRPRSGDREVPRRAGVSSFGAGGANAHIILEEWPAGQDPEPGAPGDPPTAGPYLVPLSARNPEQLKSYAVKLMEFLDITSAHIRDIAYTLQVGREALDERLAIMAESPGELKEKLGRFSAGEVGVEKLYHGQVKSNRETLAVFAVDEDMAETTATWIAKGKYAKLLGLWVKGLKVDWNLLYDERKPRRIALPTYPFAGERYWIPGPGSGVGSIKSPSAAVTAVSAVYLHPLLQQNTSDFRQQRFSSTFTGREFFLAHHVVKGQRVLPGAAYLEMARAAVTLAAGSPGESRTGMRLKNVVWAQPIALDHQPVRVHIGLFPGNNGEITYEIYSLSAAGEAEPVVKVHSQGSAVLEPALEPAALDLPALQSRCRQNHFSASQCYDTFRAMGIDYGPAHRGIESIALGPGLALARLSLPAAVSSTLDQYVLHPALLDSALQAAVGLMMDPSALIPPGLILPFALQELEILGPCTPAMWALVRSAEGATAGDGVQKLDFDLCDENGTICVRLKGFSCRVLEDETNSAPGTLMLHPYWNERAPGPVDAAPDYIQHLVILCEPGEKWKPGSWEDREKREDGNPGSEEAGNRSKGGTAHPIKMIHLQSQPGDIAERYQAYAARVFTEIQDIFKTKPGGKVLLQVVISTQDEHQLFSGLAGMLKTARLENPKLIGQLIEVEPGEEPRRLMEILEENSRSPHESRVRCQEGKRRVTDWKEIEGTSKEATLPWKDRGIYLITGGAGGLGLIFTGEIARQANNATLILTGRSPLNQDRQARLKELEESGNQTRIQYRQVDVTLEEEVENLIRGIREEWGGLDGILHCAGVIRDNFILKKTGEELQEVMASKVKGTANLDRATRELNLDFFVFFSSWGGAMGNPGQADYASANAFMDAYAGYRNHLVGLKQRQGRTLSINWPLWREGGMRVDKETEKMIYQSMGMIPLSTAAGLRAFYQALASDRDQVAVMEGSPGRMRQKLRAMLTPPVPSPRRVPAATAAAGMDSAALADNMQAALLEIVSKILNVKKEDIDVDTELNEYGFDSITLTEFANELNREYRLELNPTAFFEHPTLRDFTRYLVEEHTAVLAAPGVESDRTGVPGPARQEEAPEESPTAAKQRSRFAGTPKEFAVKPVPAAPPTPGPIAIIGMSCRFPGARDAGEFWKNLLEGKDSIREIPADRWDWREYFGDPAAETNKTNVKWGGFIDGVDEFDPLFFGISPREAELMDPQQRLLMTYAWKALEDAGYSAQSLRGTKTAIFVGTAVSDYSILISQAHPAVEGYSSTGMVPSVGPNRLSYFLDLHGPSEPVETACSSSLVAVHRAMEVLGNGTCDLAIVGGVNTILTPTRHIAYNKAGMLSEDGRCKTFSSRANGYGRGEGVGMLLLKKLEAAEAAGDHIYGLIRSTAVNHGGRANSLTAPNPRAQADLLKTAYTRAGVHPGTVTYIEAHGTGTALGDPIEINALKRAFQELFQEAGDTRPNNAYCGLGSVKTNIGHLELAAGIVGVIKVLLQLKHKTLVKSLHCDPVNPYIQLEDTPFYIVREPGEWKALPDFQGKTLPRRAGVSSFGFGGVNAHAVIEEYLPGGSGSGSVSQVADRGQAPADRAPVKPHLIILSAKDRERLSEQVRRLLTAIKERQFSDSNLGDMAYSLQVGRDAMEERLALVVKSVSQLQEKLEGFRQGREDIEEMYLGRVKSTKETLTGFSADEDMAKAIAAWAAKGKYGKLADLWVRGLFFDWNMLYDAKPGRPRRISLPTYPFAKERYWVPETNLEAVSSHPNTRRVIKSFDQTFSKVWPPAGPPEAEKTGTVEIMTFEETWQEQDLPAPVPVELKTLVCFLSDPGHQQALVQAMQSPDSSTRLIFIGQSGGGRQQSPSTYDIDRGDGAAYKKVFERIRAGYGAVDGILYLWALEDPGAVRDYSAIVRILQAMAAARLKPGRLVLAAAFENGLERCYLESWLGFERSLGLAMPRTRAVALLLDAGGQDREAIVSEGLQKLRVELQIPDPQSVLYREGKRHVRRLRPTTLSPGPGPVKPGGTYLVTGGCGGLGFLVARHLAETGPVNLILSGRSRLSEEKQAKIRALEDSGSRVFYLRADVCDSNSMKEGLSRAKERFAAIHGVIHAAGAAHRQGLLEKEYRDFQNVLDPKVTGTLVLDELLVEEPLDFTCYFSSSSAILGDFGSCDYAIANRFQTAYVHYREQLRGQGQRRGKTIVINWPLWRDGGMGSGDPENTRLYLESSGQSFLEAEAGLAVLDRLLSQGSSQHLVLVGQPGRVYRFLGLESGSPAAAPADPLHTLDSHPSPHSLSPSPPSPGGSARRLEMEGLSLEQCLQWDLKEHTGQILKIPRDRLPLDENLADFGFDSISLAEFAARLSNYYNIELTPALFFGHSTLEKLGRYLLGEYQEVLETFYRGPAAAGSESATPVGVPASAPAAAAAPMGYGYEPPPSIAAASPITTITPFPRDAASPLEPVAIIGMSGRFPQARDIHEMWRILAEAREAVQEIPLERFDWRPYREMAGSPGEKISWRCGCIPGVEEFDPLFFDISPREAESMDPRQRLLLQESWKALEDAGYGAAQLNAGKIGMFVGVEQGDYQQLAGQTNTITSNHDAILAARLAYFLNLSGPVMAINTACSSGLAAAHQACLSLRSRECDTAIAAGVNLILTPGVYVGLGRTGMLSPQGRCFAFDKRANGMVPGEAVVVVVLKLLSRARADLEIGL